jgi:hypothetical protein
MARRNIASNNSAPAMVFVQGHRPPHVRPSPKPLSLAGFLKPNQQDASIDWTKNQQILAHARVALSLIRFDKSQYNVAVRTLLWVVQSYHPATYEKASELVTIIADWWLTNHAGDAMGLAAATGITSELAFPLVGTADQVGAPSQFATVEETHHAVAGTLAGIREDGSTVDGRALIVPGR